MNIDFREGMRRVGLLLGFIGAIAGGELAVEASGPLWTEYSAHRRFESLLATPTMQGLTKVMKEPLRIIRSEPLSAQNQNQGDNATSHLGSTSTASMKLPPLPKGYEDYKPLQENGGSRNGQDDPYAPFQQPFKTKVSKPQDWFARNAPPARSKFGGIPVDEDPASGKIPDAWKEAAKNEDWKLWGDSPRIPTFAQFKAEQERKERLRPADEISVSVNLEGIKQITVDKAGVVSSIELSTGELVQKVDRPELKAYLIPSLFPVLGFLIPWGALRALTWVICGFIYKVQ